MFKHRKHHCHFPKPKKRVFKKIIKVTVIKFKPKFERDHRKHEDFDKKCHCRKRHHRHHRHHDCHRRHHKFY